MPVDAAELPRAGTSCAADWCEPILREVSACEGAERVAAYAVRYESELHAR